MVLIKKKSQLSTEKDLTEPIKLEKDLKRMLTLISNEIVTFISNEADFKSRKFVRNRVVSYHGKKDNSPGRHSKPYM